MPRGSMLIGEGYIYIDIYIYVRFVVALVTTYIRSGHVQTPLPVLLHHPLLTSLELLIGRPVNPRNPQF